MNDSRMDSSDRLDSWKKIAAHFKRDLSTVQRWERREGMPVHRHLHDKQGSVYAFRSELDVWWEGRRARLASEPEPGTAAPTAEPVTRAASRRPGWLWPSAIIATLLVLAGAALWWANSAGLFWRNPLNNARFTRLTDWPGIEQAAEISRDGRWVSFLADHDGRMDAWLTQIGSGTYRNLTRGINREFVNASIRTSAFSGDGSLITIWMRVADGSRREDIQLMAAPLSGGALQDFVPGAAEVAWSHDGTRIVYHTTAPGDPLFVREAKGSGARLLYVAPAGVHCHFPLWSFDDDFIYFARGVPPDNWDIWRIRSSGAGLERLTFHGSRVSHPVLLDPSTLLYLASDIQGNGPWLYAMDLRQRVPHRISVGLERYTSLSASADGARLVTTAAQSDSSLWSMSLDDGRALDPAARAARPVSLVSATGLAPRLGPNFLLYVSTRAGSQHIWKRVNGQSRELWNSGHALILGAPTLAPDGRRIAFIVADGDRTILYTLSSDGGSPQEVTDTLTLRGSPAWAPDGRSIVSAVLHDGEPRLTSIYLDGSPPSPLVAEYSIDPVWSPDGQYLVYSGADVGTTFPLRAVAADGRPYPIPALILTRGARRIVFRPDGRSIVVLRGEVGHKNFWSVDLRSGEEQQLTELAADIIVQDFDLSRDGHRLVFGRTQESSQIALIERGR